MQLNLISYAGGKLTTVAELQLPPDHPLTALVNSASGWPEVINHNGKSYVIESYDPMTATYSEATFFNL